MGKTYRKEQQFKRIRETRDENRGKHVNHDHERSETRRQMRDVTQHGIDEDGDDVTFED